MNIAITLRYDGTRYCGFQVQKNGLSVCEVVQDALEAVLGSRPAVKGSSRTDSGVHALAYPLNFNADTTIPMQRLPLALNAHLPADVRVTEAHQVPEDFHSRYSAHNKTYVYRIWNSQIESPFQARFTATVPKQLDECAMQAAARQLEGTHDFLALCAAGSSAAAHGDTVRTIKSCTVRREGELVLITVTADGYLYNMVRILAGTLVEAGLHKRAQQSIAPLLESRDRRLAGPTMPAKGLFLKCVQYEQEREDQG